MLLPGRSAATAQPFLRTSLPNQVEALAASLPLVVLHPSFSQAITKPPTVDENQSLASTFRSGLPSSRSHDRLQPIQSNSRSGSPGALQLANPGVHRSLQNFKGHPLQCIRHIALHGIAYSAVAVASECWILQHEL